MAQQISELKEVTETLKKYLEAVMLGKVGTKETSELIENEDRRLSEFEKRWKALRGNMWIAYLTDHGISFKDVTEALREASSFSDLAESIQKLNADRGRIALHDLMTSYDARHEANQARETLGLPPLRVPDDWPVLTTSESNEE
jgi:hypothetical protein